MKMCSTKMVRSPLPLSSFCCSKATGLDMSGWRCRLPISRGKDVEDTFTVDQLLMLPDHLACGLNQTYHPAVKITKHQYKYIYIYYYIYIIIYISSIKQSVDQTANQPTNQTNKQTASQPTSQATNQSVKSIKKLQASIEINQSTNQTLQRNPNKQHKASHHLNPTIRTPSKSSSRAAERAAALWSSLRPTWATRCRSGRGLESFGPRATGGCGCIFQLEDPFTLGFTTTFNSSTHRNAREKRGRSWEKRSKRPRRTSASRAQPMGCGLCPFGLPI